MEGSIGVTVILVVINIPKYHSMKNAPAGSTFQQKKRAGPNIACFQSKDRKTIIWNQVGGYPVLPTLEPTMDQSHDWQSLSCYKTCFFLYIYIYTKKIVCLFFYRCPHVDTYQERLLLIYPKTYGAGARHFKICRKTVQSIKETF